MGGIWGGRKLQAPKSERLRPSAGRVKLALFSILESYRLKQALPQSLEGQKVLDLFAGVGGLGLEALSRGADHCYFVEVDRIHAKFLQKNIASLEAQERCTVFLEAVEKKSWQRAAPFDVVFLDPPYAFEGLDALLAELAKPGLLSPKALVIFEHDPKRKLTVQAPLRLHSERKLGPAGVSVFICDT